MEHISTKQIASLCVSPGDTLYVTYTDSNGIIHKLDGTQFKERLTINQIAFFKLINEYGFKAGVAAMIGERE